ncbi:hypothetical protein DOTSEDRAFT_45218, partial [Dothistroma septosporum NZE10]
MSWMDSWSRPSANSKVPAPLYLSGEDVPYCQTCGRVMSSKKLSKKQNEVKYCSDRCRSRKPGAKDRQIERTIVALLNGEEGSGIENTAAKGRVIKGDPRLIVTCDEVEEAVFGSRFDPEKVFGRRKNRRTRAIGDPNAEWKSVDMESTDDGQSAEEHGCAENLDDSAPSEDGGIPIIDNFNVSHVRAPQQDSEINFSAGGGERSRAEKIEESADDLEKRRQGAKRAEEREMVRRAARRVIVFGAEVPRREHAVQKPSKSKAKAKRGGGGTDDEADTSPTEIRKAEAL